MGKTRDLLKKIKDTKGDFHVQMGTIKDRNCIDLKWRKLSAEELMLLNCGVGEDSWESLGLQGDPTSPF